MKPLFYIITIVFIVMISGCDMANKQNEFPRIECKKPSDCDYNEICEAGYCISDEFKKSDIKFSFSVIPKNRETNEKYYHPKTTEPLDISDLKKFQNRDKKIEIQVSDRVILKGKILSKKNIKFNIRAIKKDDDLQFIKSSYMSIEDGKEYKFYQLNLPRYGNYRIYVEAENSYPPFFIDIGELGDYKTMNIDVEKELSDRASIYKKIVGEIKYKYYDEEKFLENFVVYAYVFENNIEKVISSKYISDGVKGNFFIKMDKNIKNFFLKVKSLDPKYENIEINKFIENSGKEDIDLQKIDIGSFADKKNVTIKIVGNCDASERDLVSKTKIKIKGNINQITKYVKTITECSDSDKDCGKTFNNENSDTIIYNVELQSGSYNLDIITHPESCYVSKFKNINVDNNNDEFYIKLNQKLPISGNIFAVTDSVITGTIIFTRKDSKHLFKISANIENGRYRLNIEPGLYDILVKPSEKANSSWIYLNYSINLHNYENEINFFIPEALLAKIPVVAIGGKSLVSSVIKLNILPKEGFECDYNLPEKSYPLFQTITDKSGAFIVPIPIINCQKK